MMYFKLDEFVKSAVAKKYNIDNTPTKEVVKNIENLVTNILDPARAILGEPITIKSGFRSLALNSHKEIQGAPTSQHLYGEAADCVCSSNRRLFMLIKDNFEFDQLIGEDIQPGGDFKWVHVSFTTRKKNRKQVLVAKRNPNTKKMEYFDYK